MSTVWLWQCAKPGSVGGSLVTEVSDVAKILLKATERPRLAQVVLATLAQITFAARYTQLNGHAVTCKHHTVSHSNC